MVFNNVNNIISTDDLKVVDTVNCSTVGALIPFISDFESGVNY